jgi:hypothetical protein
LVDLIVKGLPEFLNFRTKRISQFLIAKTDSDKLVSIFLQFSSSVLPKKQQKIVSLPLISTVKKKQKHSTGL